MATALVLLVLTGHAFVVSATHFHRGRASSAPSVGGPQAGRPSGAQDAPLAGGHEQCLLCRLQRDLFSGLQHSAPALDAPQARPAGRLRPSDAPTHGPQLLFRTGRAPPAA